MDYEKMQGSEGESRYELRVEKGEREGSECGPGGVCATTCQFWCYMGTDCVRFLDWRVTLRWSVISFREDKEKFRDHQAG